jgi:hypothetical protein
MGKHYRKENNCLNCGTTLHGKFCQNCGQENLEIHESFGHMMNHQFFHTLKPLLFKPGFLTNEYMAGRRVKYLHPVKMYIFISVVYFLLLFQSGQEIVHVNSNDKKTAKNEIAAAPGHNKDLDSTKAIVARSSMIPNATKKEIEKDIEKQKADDRANDKDVVDYSTKPNRWFHPTTKDTSYAQYLTNQRKLPEKDRDGALNSLWNKKVFDYTEKYGSHAKEVFVEHFEHNLPKMMFVLLPLFALILKVTFFRSKKFYVEHLIYAFHFHCFFFLFLAIIILLNMVFPASWVIGQWIDLLATFYIIWYLFRSLRIVYQRGWLRTVTKLVGMSLMYFLAFMFCLALVGIVTAVV